MAGKLTAEKEKPVPLTAIEFTVTGAVPLELSVTVWLVELFVTIEPNEMLAALMVNVAVAAFNCSARVRAVFPALALRVADCAVVTAATVAIKVVLLAVAGIVTELGTVTALLPLDRATLTPPVGAEPVRLTVQESASDPVMDVLLHDTALTVGVTAIPVPLRLMEAVGAVLEIVICPVAALVLVGSN